MMMTNNIIFLFQLFSDPEPLDNNSIQEIRKEWTTYFISIRIKYS